MYVYINMNIYIYKCMYIYTFMYIYIFINLSTNTFHRYMNTHLKHATRASPIKMRESSRFIIYIHLHICLFT